jgi:hypothetical protein
MKKLIAILALSLISQFSFADPDACMDRYYDDWILEYGNVKGITEDIVKEWEEDCGLVYETPENEYTLSIDSTVRYYAPHGIDFITLINEGDTLYLTGYLINRGNCGGKKDGYKAPGRKLEYGETMRMWVNSNCRILSAVVYTNVGAFEWEF